MSGLRGQRTAYLAIVLAGFLVAVLAGWTSFATYIDNDAYDLMYRLHPPQPWTPHSILLSIDEKTLSSMGGSRRLRTILADGLERVAAVKPSAVAIDLILADEGIPEEDARLEQAFRRLSNLVLATDLLPRGEAWEEPLSRFRDCAAAVGHAHADQDPLDGVSRVLPLEKVSRDHQRKWALALEAFRLSRGAPILESPSDLRVGDVVIPAPRNEEGRSILIRYPAVNADGSSPIPQISFQELADHPELARQFRGKVVFVGVTAQSEARDRLMTPLSSGRMMTGVEIHVSGFETLSEGRFFARAGQVTVLLLGLFLAVAGGLAFSFRSGWQPYVLGVLILLAAHLLPYIFFTRGLVVPYFSTISSAWLPLLGVAAFQHFVVRKQLRKSETDKARYQEAMHFVTHELRTPLTAIQGSSELISRYNLDDDKRKQIANLINTESKRLARMIETFLNVERLSAGHMELKQEAIPARELVNSCVDRARQIAERKQIRILVQPIGQDEINGDRELMEYAFYNLVTNAIKYSPSDTQVTISSFLDGGRIHLSVADQGIGMDQQELRKIFQKFYRTRRAEATGEKGTGIGLSIVQQIVTQHSGHIDVVSEPGKGSRFTIVVPVRVTAPAAENQRSA